MTTLTELQALTKVQLIAKLLEGQTEEKVETEYFPNGELKRQVRQAYDGLGKLLSTREITWNYYPTGEVDIITMSDAAGTRRIQHFLDGRQPEVK